MNSERTQEPHPNNFYTRKVLFFHVGIFLFVVVSVIVTFLTLSHPTSDFPENSEIVIEEGMGLRNIVELFEEKGYVRSSNLLHTYIIFEKAETHVQAGTYLFTEPLSVQALASHIIQIGPKEHLQTLTFPEGIAAVQFASIAAKNLPEFNVENFIKNAEEGTLFPETYFVPVFFTGEDLLALLSETYEENISPLREEINAHALSEYEILVLASIIEREANDVDSMKMVSGILQNRLAIDMALQADASIEYVLNKPLSELTSADLKIDSPYNTYLNIGLPPTPIGNPGLDAIQAVLTPTPSQNFFYITDPNGEFHYAQTFDQHRSNIARYLR
jgi:UPF0755 protein